MEVRHLGDPDCSYERIAHMIINCPTRTEFCQQFFKLMVELNTVELVRDQNWKNVQHNPEKYLGEAIISVLKEWTSRVTREDATLDQLLNTLRKCNLSSIANEIDRDFYPENHGHSSTLCLGDEQETAIADNTDDDEENLFESRNRRKFTLRQKAIASAAIVILLLLVVMLFCLLIFWIPAASHKVGCSFVAVGKDKIVNQWSAEIINSENHTNIYQDLQACANTSNTNELISLFEESVLGAFGGGLKNASMVLDFMRNVPVSWLKYYGYAILHDSMKQHGLERTSEMMKLIYYVRLAMLGSMDANLFPKYEFLKFRFPSDMAAITFSENVTIKNRAFSEYLYVAGRYVEGKNLVLGWVPGEQVNQDNFTFHPEDINGTVHYIIRNSFYAKDAPLCISESWYTTDRKYIVTCPGENHVFLRWFVEPNGSYFTFKNWDAHFLYSPSNDFLYDSDRRYVFSWRGEPVDMSGDENWQYEINKSGDG